VTCTTDSLAEDMRALFGRDRASQAFGMRLLEVAPGRATLAMNVRADMVNGHDICHGGCIFALADSAFAFACNAGRPVTVAAGAAIDYLRPARLGEELVAVALERSRSRRTGLYDVTVQNAAGELVAMFRGRSHQLDGR